MKKDIDGDKPIIAVYGASGMDCVHQAGAIPMLGNWRNLEDAVALARWADGILLMGGADVNPLLYAKSVHAKVYGVDSVRDDSEMAVLDIAQRRGIPVMGICRGSQIMAVHAGAKLRQHIPGHSGTRHTIKPTKGSTLELLGDKYNVVSLHHQVVMGDTLPHDWAVAAYDVDGVTVEAIQTIDYRCLGVQFHPEMQAQTGHSRAMFYWLAYNAAERAGLPAPKLPSGWTMRHVEWSENA